MQRMKKTAAGLLCLIMMLSAASCGSNQNEATGETTTKTGTQNTTEKETDDLDDIIPKETVTLEVYSQLANYSGEQIGWFADVLKEKFNVKLNIINNAEGTFATRMEAGNLGDIVVFGNDSDDYVQAAKAGLLFDWEDEDLLDEYGSYIKEHMGVALDKNRGITGKLYGFGFDVSESADQHAAYFYYPDVRFDLYEEIGSPKISTLEDYIPMFEAMQKACPTSDSGGKTYAVSMFPDWDGNMVMYVKATAALYGYDEFGFGLYNMDKQEYEDALKKDGMYLRCLKFYNQLYQKGLVDPDSMTQTFNEAAEAYKDGAAFFNLFHWMGGDLYNTDAHVSEGKAMYALTPDDAKNYVDGLNVFGGNRVWTIGSKTAEPELCMAIINWLCTPEGYMTMKYGPKGATWDLNDSGKAYFTELGKSAITDGSSTDMSAAGYSGFYTDGMCQINNTTWAPDAINPETGESYNYLMWQSYNESLVPSDILSKWRKWAGANNADEYLEKNGHISIKLGTSFSESTKDADLTTVWAQVADCIKTGSWNAVYANSDEEFNKIVDDMISKANEYGYEKCVEFQQKEAERRKALEDEAKKAN
ncbi:MAG: extracellular solute-binding protein [Ruminococcus sp.]|nr:extracellular solute-binding protein [Ruminococcus sp.]